MREVLLLRPKRQVKRLKVSKQIDACSNLENRVRTVRRGEKTDNQSMLEVFEENKSCNNSQL